MSVSSTLACANMSLPTSDVTSAESQTPTHTDAKHPNSAQAEYIYVPDNFKVKEGVKLAEDLFVGKALGVGLQVNFIKHQHLHSNIRFSADVIM